MLTAAQAASAAHHQLEPPIGSHTHLRAVVLGLEHVAAMTQVVVECCGTTSDYGGSLEQAWASNCRALMGADTPTLVFIGALAYDDRHGPTSHDPLAGFVRIERVNGAYRVEEHHVAKTYPSWVVLHYLLGIEISKHPGRRTPSSIEVVDRRQAEYETQGFTVLGPGRRKGWLWMHCPSRQ